MDDGAKVAKDTKDAKKKTQITQISADLFCELCGFNHPIGGCAKVAKGRKDAKEKTSVVSVALLCLLCFSFPIGVNLCQSVDVFLRNLRL